MNDVLTERPARRGRVRPSRKHGRARVVLAAVLLVLLVGAGVVAGAWWSLFLRADAPVEAGRPVQLEIPEGASTLRIAEILAERGIVDNANMFRLQARLAEADGQLRAGIYDMTTGMGYDAAIELLRQGPPIKYVTVTIPEGFVIEQIAERLEAQANIPASEFLALADGGAAEFDREYLGDVSEGSLEGYLFPKTYRIREGSTARDVIEMMLDQYEREIATVDLAPGFERGLSHHEIMTIASLIERETRVPAERELVSSVIRNRLERGMRLEIDATIEYFLEGNRLRLLYEHLRIDNPYNTYMYAGLPPGPIANPGIEAIQAAVAPADTDYIYYVLTSPDGSHTFTRTLEEHNRAKARSKEVFGR